MELEEKLTEAELEQFIGTTQHFKHPLGLLFTDGVHYLAEKGKAYWLIDCIASYQGYRQVREMSIQFWRLKVKEDRSALLELGEDLPEPIILRQKIPYTNFPLKQITLYLVNNVLHLPSEY